MKNIKFIIITALLLLTVTNCKKPDNVIYDVLENKQYGAALRTLDIPSNIFNMNDQDNSAFVVVVEEQDEEYGDLLDKVNVYVSFIDKTDDGVENSKDEQFLTSIPASEFTQSEKGLPMTTYSATFNEAVDALGLQDGEYFGGDTFKFRFEVVLTDGRSFSEDSSGSTLQQSFFNSPYAYYVNIVCIPPAPIPGDYEIEMFDAYGDGWQGSKIVATLDGTPYEFSLPNLWDQGYADPNAHVGEAQFVHNTATLTVPAGATELKWEFVAGDWPSEVSFKIYGPNSGNVIYEDGPSPAEGEFFPNYCNE